MNASQQPWFHSTRLTHFIRLTFLFSSLEDSIRQIQCCPIDRELGTGFLKKTSKFGVRRNIGRRGRTGIAIVVAGGRRLGGLLGRRSRIFRRCGRCFKIFTIQRLHLTLQHFQPLRASGTTKLTRSRQTRPCDVDTTNQLLDCRLYGLDLFLAGTNLAKERRKFSFKLRFSFFALGNSVEHASRYGSQRARKGRGAGSKPSLAATLSQAIPRRTHSL